SYDGHLRFVVQRHRARRLHYDLRLELDGVFVSWAVPKGPTLDATVRSLAVKVEDHPLDYGWFEGVIPSGYGKGDVIVWDDGWWELDPEDERGLDAAAALDEGELKFVLHGRKLNGRFVILRTKDDQWLLLHKRGDTAVPGWQPEEHPRSVLSGRTNEEVLEAVPARWDGPTKTELAALDALGTKGEWELAGTTIAITNLDKVLIPGRGSRQSGITKRDIVRYYARIAPWIAPYLAGRPVNLHRYPDGVERSGFWHKAVPAHAPPWVRRWPNPLADVGETHDYLLVDGAPALVWAANFAGIELHPWTSTAAGPEEPSYALVDIDPGTETTWDETLLLARLFRTAIDHLGIVARPKVTGQRGIQILIPVCRGYTFENTRTFVETVSRTVGGIVPDLVSWRWQKGERRGKARLDYTQNMINKTLVAPYSIRPAAGAPVSVPIEWDELDDPDLRPDRWTIDDVFDRLDDIGDPFTALIGCEQELPAL
ncbi:MAG: DNA polymerase ligase N-terminal domain-containing protein, partial [Acidimicrobiia bacterium]